jgi:hypothetical protein
MEGRRRPTAEILTNEWRANEWPRLDLVGFTLITLIRPAPSGGEEGKKIEGKKIEGRKI